jgi:small-conductance mechanosensitive channel
MMLEPTIATLSAGLWVAREGLGLDAGLRLPEVLEQFVGSIHAGFGQRLGWSAAVLLAALLSGWLVAVLVFRALGRWAKKTDTVIDDALAVHMRRPLRWLMPLLALNVALPFVSLAPDARPTIRQLLLVLVIAATGWTAARAIRVVEYVVSEREDLRRADNLEARALLTQTRGLRNVANFLIVMLTLGFILVTFERVRQLGTGLLASAGVAGIVLGFAAQRTIATILAGVQIALTQPFRVDDVVIVEGEWGRIEEITLTYVVVRIWDKRRLILPITYFIEKPFQNWTRVSADLLGTVNLYLDYSVPVDEIRKECKRILEQSPLWDREAWCVQVTDTSEHTMLVRPLFSAKNSSDQWDLRCEVREKLISFVQNHYPHALPRLRAQVDSPSPES